MAKIEHSGEVMKVRGLAGDSRLKKSNTRTRVTTRTKKLLQLPLYPSRAPPCLRKHTWQTVGKGMKGEKKGIFNLIGIFS